MSEIRFLAPLLLSFFLLAGCVPVPIVGWTPVYVAGPMGFDLPGYSLGPVSSDQFPDLVGTALPADEGQALLFGRVEMILGADNHDYLFSAVAVLSDTDILLLKWYEPEDRYKILARLPYSEILSVSINTWGLGRSIYLCLATTEFVLAGQDHAIEPRVSMAFIEPSGFLQDRERSEAAFALLQGKIDPIDGACETPVEMTDGGVDTLPPGLSE
jgi:hypothetical protein